MYMYYDVTYNMMYIHVCTCTVYYDITHDMNIVHVVYMYVHVLHV